MKKIFALLSAVLFVQSIHAQESAATENATSSSQQKVAPTYKNYNDDFSNWSIGINAGISTTFGDLSSFNLFREVNADFPVNGGLEFGFSGSLTYMTNAWWGVRGTAFMGNISGLRDDEFVNQSFRASMQSIQMDFLFNPINAFRIQDTDKNRKWALLLNAGLGVAFLNNYEISDSSLDEGVYEPGDSRAMLDMSDGLITPFAAFGFEIKYQVIEPLSIDFGAQYRYFFSDRADGRESGNRSDVGQYVYLGLTYNFGKKGKQRNVAFTSPLGNIYNIAKSAESKVDLLTADSDGDGVSDYFDKDPDTPEGVAVDGAGRPLDVDMDGIPDYMDADPFTNKGAKVDKDGREIDSDGDGVPDSQDLEPNTPRGALVDVRGREIDLSKGGAQMVDAFLPQVYFAFNSATVTAANRERLATIARVLQNNENISLELVGHTDKVGSEEYNQKLGERRAQAVKDYLVKNFSIDASRLQVKSKGKGQPLAKYNHINRRVEMFINIK